jgi:hypothetical protein
VDSLVRGTVVFGAGGVTNTTIALPTPAEGYVWEVSSLQINSSGASFHSVATGWLSAAPGTAAAVVSLMAGGGFLLAATGGSSSGPVQGTFPATGPRCVSSSLVLSINAGAATTCAYEIGIKRRRLTQDILNTMAAYTS